MPSSGVGGESAHIEEYGIRRCSRSGYMAGFVIVSIRDRWLSDLAGEASRIPDGQPNNEEKAADFFVTDREDGVAKLVRRVILTMQEGSSSERIIDFGDWCNW